MILEPKEKDDVKENNPGKRNRMAKMEQKKNLRAGSETEKSSAWMEHGLCLECEKNLLSLVEVRREFALHSVHN